MIDLIKNGGVNCKKCNNFIDLEHLHLFEFEMSSGLTGSSFRGLCGGDESCDTSYGWDEIEGYPRTEDVNEEESMSECFSCGNDTSEVGDCAGCGYAPEMCAVCVCCDCCDCADEFVETKYGFMCSESVSCGSKRNGCLEHFELVTDKDWDGVEPRIRDCDHYSIKERLEESK